MNRPAAAALVAVALFARPLSAAPDPFVYTWQEIAPGVWTGIRENSPRSPVLGNATLVVSEEGVVVFDGGGAPLASERILEKVRALTDKPVTHVVISHWHGDHSFGIHRLIEAFPAAQVVAHPYTRANLSRNVYDDSFEKQYLPTVRQRLEAGVGSNGQPLTAGDIAYFTDVLDNADLIAGQYRESRATLPNVTFEDSLTIWSGGREIRLLHLGLSNTAGDVVMHLPAERIVATGDMVVGPTPYGFGSYPRAWAGSLRRIQALGPAILVPGHGDVQRDMAYVDLLIETFESIAGQMDRLVAEGLTEDEAKARMDFSAVEARFTHDDPFLARLFQIWFKDPITAAAYRVAKGQSPEVG